MKSRVRILSVLAVGVLLCTAISASAAFGSVLKSEINPTSISSTTAPVSFKFTPGQGSTGGQLDCKEMKLRSGQVEGKIFSKITLTPQFKGCSWLRYGPSVPVSVNVGGCGFELVMPAGASMVASMNIVPVGCVINISGTYCNVKISSQSGLSGVTLANSGVGKKRVVSAQFAIKGLTSTGSTSACGGAETSETTFTKGEMTGSTTLVGYSDEAETFQQGIWVE